MKTTLKNEKTGTLTFGIPETDSNMHADVIYEMLVQAGAKFPTSPAAASRGSSINFRYLGAPFTFQLDKPIAIGTPEENRMVFDQVRGLVDNLTS
jgi:hypothetical protein